MAASDDAEAHGDLALVDEIVTLTLAGHETTANGLTFALVALARHPDVLARVRAEIDAVLGAREAPDLADLPNLPYTKAVVDEALRLWPPAWSFEREAVEDDVVCGLPVPKGATVVVSPWVLHRHPKLWDAPRVVSGEVPLDPSITLRRAASAPASPGAPDPRALARRHPCLCPSLLPSGAVGRFAPSFGVV